jgi:hypothetical protein
MVTIKIGKKEGLRWYDQNIKGGNKKYGREGIREKHRNKRKVEGS